MPQNTQQEQFDQMVAAGATVVRGAADAANRAISNFDFDAAAAKLSSAVDAITTRLDAIVRKPEPSRNIVVPSGSRMQGTGMIAGGIVLGTIACGGVLGAAVLGLVVPAFAVAMGVIGVGSAAGAVALIAKGAGLHGLVSDTERIRTMVSTQVVVPLDDLASRMGFPAAKMRDRVQKAIRNGFIPQGRVASVNGMETLFLTDGAYREFERYEQGVRADEVAHRNTASLPESARSIVAACEDFAQRMLAASGKITHQATRDKMATLTGKVARVSEYVQAHPEDSGRFRRYISYYLPTTAKLADAYAELDAANATGEAAERTRAEVDDMLELVASATDNLLNDIYLDQQLDVASDASAMRTMLTQDGLTD